MCGRVDIHTPPAQLARALEAQLAAGIDPDGRPSWNVGPTRAIPAIVSTEDHHRVLDLFRWGGVENTMRELVHLVAEEVEPYDAVHPETLDLYRRLSRRAGFRRGA
jgi:putative SOS response-associated peptidase YedK